MKKLIVAGLMVIALVGAAGADVILQYTFTGSVNTPSTEHAIITGTSFGVSPQTGFAYLTTGGAPNVPGVGTATWNAGTPTAYWSFGLTFDAGYEFADSPDSLLFDFEYRATGTGPTSWQLDYNSGSGWNTLASGGLTANSAWHSISGADISGLDGVGGTVDFRLYGYGAPSATGTWIVDTVTLNGSVYVIPEPGTLVMMGLGLIGIMFARRMRK